MPGVWKEVQRPEKYDCVPTEKSFWVDREDPVVVGIRGRCCGSEATNALEEVFGVREIISGAGYAGAAYRGGKLHERFLAELELIHVQLDELWANVKHGGEDMWLWVAHDATTKLIPVLQVGGRSQEMAYLVVHELKSRLAVGCVPVFSTDGLKHYYDALTAHFGKWEWAGGKKPVWVLLSEFIYSQVISFAKQTPHQRRRKTVEVERRVLVGEAAAYRERLCQAGLSGRINTSFVERLNLTIRQSVSKLTRRTWGSARYTSELDVCEANANTSIGGVANAVGALLSFRPAA